MENKVRNNVNVSERSEKGALYRYKTTNQLEKSRNKVKPERHIQTSQSKINTSIKVIIKIYYCIKKDKT